MKRFLKPNSNRFNSNAKQRRREAQSRKVTEKELTALHHKIVSKKIVFSSLFLNHDIIHIVYIRKSYANECFVIRYKNLHKYRLLPK